MGDGVVVRKLDGRAEGDRKYVWLQRLTSGHHLETGRTARGGLACGLEPDQRFGGDGMLSTFGDEGDFARDGGGREIGGNQDREEECRGQ